MAKVRSAGGERVDKRGKKTRVGVRREGGNFVWGEGVRDGW